jgi:HAMP domain-containing protein
VTVVAVPLCEVGQNRSRLLWVDGLVLGAVLLLIAALAWVIVRVGLLPLARIGHAAGRIASGDLSHRVAQTDGRSDVGRLGLAFDAMLDRLEDAFRRREASERRLRQFLADASHELRAARLDPWLRRAAPHRRGAGGDREVDAADRGRGRAHGRPRRGPRDARPPRPCRRSGAAGGGARFTVELPDA